MDKIKKIKLFLETAPPADPDAEKMARSKDPKTGGRPRWIEKLMQRLRHPRGSSPKSAKDLKPF